MIEFESTMFPSEPHDTDNTVTTGLEERAAVVFPVAQKSLGQELETKEPS